MKTSFVQRLSKTIFVFFLLCVYSALGAGELKNIDLSENSWQISDLTVSKTEPPLPDIKEPNIPQNWQPVEISRSWHEQFPHTYPEGKRNEMFWYQNNPIPHYVSGWYKTGFNTPQYGSDENVILKFDGAAYKALVFLNGNYVGSHKGSFTPFEFDVSGYLTAQGSENTLHIWIYNDFGEAPPRHAYGKMFFYSSNMGGIEQPVYLMVKPAYRVKDIRIDPDVESRIVRFNARAVSPSDSLKGKTVKASVEDTLGNTIVSSAAVDETNGYITGEINAASLELWDIDRAVLYNLVIEMEDEAGKPLGRSVQKFGYRQFKADGTRFYLNGKRVKTYFGNILTYSYGRYDLPQGREQFTQWVLRQKQHGVNAVRYHMAGPNAKAILDICDGAGILVMQEFPLFHRVFSDIPSVDDQRAFLDNVLVELRDFMYRDYNHPSVVLWSLSNEVWHNNLRPVYEELYRVGSEIETGGRPLCTTSGLNSFGVPNYPVSTDHFDDHNYDMHKVCAPLIADSIARRHQNVRDLYGSIDKPWIVSEFDAPPKGRLPVDPALDTVAAYLKHKDDFRVKKIGLKAASQNDVYDKLLQLHSKRIYEFMRSNTVFQGFHPWYTDRNSLPEWFGQLASPYTVLMNPAKYNVHWYSSKPVRLDVVVMKDPEIKFEGKVTAKITDIGGQTIYSVDTAIKMGTKEDRIDFEIKLTNDKLDAGSYQLVFELTDADNTIINTNSYSIDVFEETPRFAAKANVGYFGNENQLSNLSPLIDKMYFTQIADAGQFERFDRVILLPDSLGSVPQWFTHNRLSAWLEKGGRLLVLEQGGDGYLSFLEGFKLDSDLDACNNFVDILAAEHPIVNNLQAGYFRDWVGNRNLIVSTGLSPLNDNVLIANGNYSALTAGRVGKGEIILSQIQASERLGAEPVADIYLHNLFDYLFNQPIWENTKEMTLPEYPLVSWPDDIDWQPIPLKDHCNKSTTDTREAGTSFLDLGSSDLSHAPVGRHVFCNVPFVLESPDKPNIIVTRGSKMPLLPEFAGPIAVNDTAKFFAFLHTAYYSNDRPMLTYKINYKDGSAADIPIVGKKHIGDWYEPKDVSEAVVAWSKMHPKVGASYGFYIYIWENPSPHKPVESITVESGWGAVPIIVAISYGR